MIAPLRMPESPTTCSDERLREAHEYVATTFLSDPPAEVGPTVSSWKAWLFVAWVVATAAAFAASMMGWI